MYSGINDLIENKEKYIPGIIKARDELVYNLANSSNIGATYIDSLFKKIVFHNNAK